MTSSARATVQAIVASALKQAPVSRIQAAEEVSRLSGERITLHMLNDFTAKGKTRFPLYLVGFFSEAVGDDRLQRFAMGPRFLEMAELGELVTALLDEAARERLVALCGDIAKISADLDRIRSESRAHRRTARAQKP